MRRKEKREQFETFYDILLASSEAFWLVITSLNKTWGKQ